MTEHPKISKIQIEENIIHVEYVKHVTKSGQILRWAVLTAKNGFSVTGRPSAAVCAENDNEEMGKKVAYDNAFDEYWPLMGYHLKQSIYESNQ